MSVEIQRRTRKSVVQIGKFIREIALVYGKSNALYDGKPAGGCQDWQWNQETIPLSDFQNNSRILIHRPLLKHVYLTGYRGTGKTSVATQLAVAIGCPVVDLDARIQSHAGCRIRDIFANSGEQGFRDLESEILSIVATETPAVVALGGGAILRESNRERIRSSGQCVWLVATAETLASRIEADETTSANRPALTQLGHLDEIRQLLLARQPDYEDAANARIDTTGKSIEQVSDEILAVCRDRQWC